MGRRKTVIAHGGHHHHYLTAPFPDACRRNGHGDDCEHMTGDWHYHDPDQCDYTDPYHDAENLSAPCGCPEVSPRDWSLDVDTTQPVR
jgi:hypothetical protein